MRAAGLAAALGTAVMLLGRWLPNRRTTPIGCGPLGLVQAFRQCPVCRRATAHILHTTACRRCTACGHLTYPGDPT